MSAPQKTPEKTVKNKGEHKKTIDAIKARRSHELIIGLCGAIGAGTKELQEELGKSLNHHGYAVEKIKISKLIFEVRNDPSLASITGDYDRYNKYQDAGNDIRERLGESHLAEETIAEIIKMREKHLDTDKPDDARTTNKVAYIIDQLKHPSEVLLLQTIYRQNFYLIGINNTQEQRKRYLEDKGIDPHKADALIRRDRKEPKKHGQQVEDTFTLSDYFIHNKQNSELLKTAIERFIELVHGVNGKTPTKHEKGMYEAFSASLQSACLSRQVGAAIMNEKGDIVSTGCNDVPAYGGGLYTSEHGADDKRCIFKGRKCYNDLHKNLLQNQFEDILKEHIPDAASSLAEELLKSTKAKDLIEYSRAIHAEMAAIMQLARSSGQSTIGSTLYCTTYPCHNCARHIVAAGINKVIYIEPYEKSLALQLHDDTISHIEEKRKVRFEPFQGVSPRRYLKFFQAGDRKYEGKAVIIRPADSPHIDPQYLDGYTDYEAKVMSIRESKSNPF